MKMYPPGYHHNGFVATHALGHIYIYIYISRYICISRYSKKKLYIYICIYIVMSIHWYI